MATPPGGSSIRTAALALAAATIGVSVLVAAATAPPRARAGNPELIELCSSIQVPGLALKSVEAKGLSCGDARSTLRGWLEIATEPDHPIAEVGRPEHRLGYWCPEGAGELGRTWRCPLGSATISFKPVLARPLSRCPGFSGGASGVTGPFPSVSEMSVHVITCGQARDLVRFWLENPQGDFGGYFPRIGPWSCGRPQPDFEEPNPAGPVGCSFAQGGTTAEHEALGVVGPI